MWRLPEDSPTKTQRAASPQSSTHRARREPRRHRRPRSSTSLTNDAAPLIRAFGVCAADGVKATGSKGDSSPAAQEWFTDSGGLGAVVATAACFRDGARNRKLVRRRPRLARYLVVPALLDSRGRPSVVPAER